MLLTLLSLVLFGLVMYLLWVFWCQHASTSVMPGAPRWVKRPNFLGFLFVGLIVLFIYRKLTRR